MSWSPVALELWQAQTFWGGDFLTAWARDHLVGERQALWILRLSFRFWMMAAWVLVFLPIGVWCRLRQFNRTDLDEWTRWQRRIRRKRLRWALGIGILGSLLWPRMVAADCWPFLAAYLVALA